MSKKIKKIIKIFTLFLIIIGLFYFCFQYFYLGHIKDKVEFSFDKQTKFLTFSFPNPISQKYFLKNFKVIPEVRGEFFFKNQLQAPLHFLGYKQVQFIPERLERDKNYRVKLFNKEFGFLLPSPKPKDIVFNEGEKNIEISFFEPIEKDYFFEKFQIEPKVPGEYIFLDSNTKVVFKPEVIEEDKDYKAEILGKNLSFKIESPKVEKLYFDKTKKEVVITFTKPIEKERLLKNFKIIPEIKGDFIFNDSGTSVVFKPIKIDDGKNYQVEILGKTLTFRIEPQKKLKPQIQSTSQGSLNSDEKLIDVDLSEQKLRLYQNGKLVGEYITSTGKPETPTPTGNFYVLSKQVNIWSGRFGVYLPYAVRFYKDYFIHELPYRPDGYREGEGELGIPASHGCVRVGIGVAEEIYNFAEIGTKIIIHE